LNPELLVLSARTPEMKLQFSTSLASENLLEVRPANQDSHGTCLSENMVNHGKPHRWPFE